MLYDDIKARIAQRLKALDLSERSASLAAGGNPDVIRNIRLGKSKNPTGRTVSALAEVLKVSEQWLLTGEDQPAAETAPTPQRGSAPAERAGTTIPILGTAAGAVISESFEGTSLGEPIGRIQLPPALEGTRGLYAVYVAGESMQPMHSPGDLRIIHPHKPALPGQSVVVQTRAWDADPGQAYIKIYERSTPDKVILRQLNPPATIEIPARHVTALHRVLTTAELFGV